MSLRIKKIALENFRNHERSEITFDRLTVIKGPNNSGKTSVKNAIELALTGRADFTDRGGRGNADAIRDGARQAAVILDVEGLGEVKRIIRRSGASLQVADWTGNMALQQAELYKRIGAGADLISAALNLSEFISLPPKEQVQLLFKVIQPTLERADLARNIGEDAIAELQKHIDVPEKISLEWVDAAYKAAYNARREAKKERERLQGKQAGFTDIADVTVGLPDSEELARLEKELEELKREEKSLRERLDIARERGAEKKYLADRIRKLEDKLEGIGSEEPAVEVNAEQLQNELGQLERQLSGVRNKSRDIAEEIRRIDQTLSSVKKWRGECPLSPEYIKCKMSSDDRRKLEQSLGAKRYKLVEEHKKIVKSLGPLENKVANIKSQLGNLEAMEAIKAASEELAAARERLDILSGDEIEAAKLASEHDRITEQIHRLENLIAKASMTRQIIAARSEVQSKIIETDKSLQLLEKLVDAFGPQGLKAKLLSEAMSRIVRRVEDNLNYIAGGKYNIEIALNSELKVAVNGLAVRQLSASEKARVGMSWAEALAYVSGLGLFLLDDLEILDTGNRKLVTNWLLKRLNDHNNIIALATADEAQPPGVKGIAAYWLQDGTVIPLANVNGR